VWDVSWNESWAGGGKVMRGRGVRTG